MLRLLLAPFLCFAALCGLADAQFSDESFGFGAPSEETQMRMVPEVTSLAPGDSFDIALELKHPEDWHSYYINSGGIEEPPKIEWELPEGFTAGPIQWPTPEVKEGYFGKSFIFNGTPVFLTTITPPATLEPGQTVTLRAKPTWQICKDLCKDEPKEPYFIDFTLPVTAEEVIDDTVTTLFKEAKAAQPQLSDDFEFSAHLSGKTVELNLTPSAGTPDLSSLDFDFIPDQPYVLSLSSEGSSLEKTEDGWRLILPTKEEKITGEKIPRPTALSGILVADGAFHSGLLVPEIPFSKKPAPPLSFSEFVPILAGMLIGGLILNLMPCVFPVIGLKIMGFVQQAGEDRKKIIGHGLAFVVGVLLSFWVLSGILLIARETANTDISWGYQLQNKWFVYGLVMLFWVFGLSMY
ncbi:MAG: protein-disulfide reductase DsbD domain-containing protein, partial [Verrucomicrobiales bacterium]